LLSGWHTWNCGSEAKFIYAPTYLWDIISSKGIVFHSYSDRVENPEQVEFKLRFQSKLKISLVTILYSKTK